MLLHRLVLQDTSNLRNTYVCVCANTSASVALLHNPIRMERDREQKLHLHEIRSFDIYFRLIIEPKKLA